MKAGDGMRKLQLGIIFGSRSCEHEVSVISALQLARQADRDKYDLVLIYVSQQGEWFTGEPLADLNTYRPRFKPDTKGLLRVLPDLTARSGALIAFSRGGLFRGESRRIAARLDCVIPVLHGLHGEDGTVQGLLELMDLPYASTGVAGSAVGMDKVLMKQCFRGMGFPVLDFVAVLRSQWRRDHGSVFGLVEDALAYPVFVKPANLGSSIGVSRADSRGELEEALDLAAEYDRRILVEKGLDSPLELNCSVLGFDDEALPSVLEMPVTGGQALDFSAKYLRSGGTKGMASLSRVVPAPVGADLTRRIRELSVRVFRALDCRGVVRIDYMLDAAADELYITEINTIPGSLAFYLWNRSEPPLSYRELIDRLVGLALKAHEAKNENSYAYRSEIFLNPALDGAKGAKGTKTARGS